MKKWAVVGIVAAVIVGVLLIGKYQDQKYPIQSDHSNLLEEVTWWVNRGYDQPVLDVTIHDDLDLGDHRYILVDIGDELGMVYLEKGMNDQYRMVRVHYSGGNFHIEEMEEDEEDYLILSGKNQYFGIAEISFEADGKTYWVEIPEGDRFLSLVELDPPVDPESALRRVRADSIRFYDANGQDITDQIPWNGMQPWDGSPSVTQT